MEIGATVSMRGLGRPHTHKHGHNARFAAKAMKCSMAAKWCDGSRGDVVFRETPGNGSEVNTKDDLARCF